MVAIATAQDKGFAARRSSRSTYPSPCFPPSLIATALAWQQVLSDRSQNTLIKPSDAKKRQPGPEICPPRQILSTCAMTTTRARVNRAHIARHSRCSYPQDSESVVASTCPTISCHGMRLRGAGRGRTFLTVCFCAGGKRPSRREPGFRGARKCGGASSSTTGRLISTANAVERRRRRRLRRELCARRRPRGLCARSHFHPR